MGSGARIFAAATSYWDTSDPAVHFNSALDDTRIELDSIISNYEKHGEPASSLPAAVPKVAIELPTARPAASPLMPKPGDLTADWLRANVPFEYVKWASGALGIVFLAGMAIDRAYESVISQLARQGAAAAVVEPPKLQTSTVQPTKAGPLVVPAAADDLALFGISAVRELERSEPKKSE